MPENCSRRGLGLSWWLLSSSQQRSVSSPSHQRSIQILCQQILGKAFISNHLLLGLEGLQKLLIYASWSEIDFCERSSLSTNWYARRLTQMLEARRLQRKIWTNGSSTELENQRRDVEKRRALKLSVLSEGASPINACEYAEPVEIFTSRGVFVPQEGISGSTLW